MTAIGLLVMAAGAALIWAGVTDKQLMPEIRAALGNPDATSTTVKRRADGTFVLPGDKDQTGVLVPAKPAPAP